MFWSSALQVAAKMDSLRAAEQKLIDNFAYKFGRVHDSKDMYDVQIADTLIPRSSVPLKPESSSSSWLFGSAASTEADASLTMHSIHVRVKNDDDDNVHNENNTSDTPLVIVHGYMNAAAYFYRNLIGLTHYFKKSGVYSVDLLGYGLSSRPDFSQLVDDSVETAEDFFVESLEQWRRAQNLPKMILAGHSLGGYLSVAYTERYPEHVERLVLLSPVGVPDEQDRQHKEWQERINSSYRTRAMVGVMRTMFKTTTPGSVLRSLSESRARGMINGYVERRLPEISDPAEQEAVSDYLFKTAALPGSAEYCISKFLNPTILAKKPLQNRIPLLKVPHVNFLYGGTDWMPVSAALSTQQLCERTTGAPSVNVFVVPEAGHLLMLQNWDGFNAAVIHASGGKVPAGRLPIHMKPEEGRDSTIDDSPLKNGLAMTRTAVEQLEQESRSHNSRPEVSV